MEISPKVDHSSENIPQDSRVSLRSTQATPTRRNLLYDATAAMAAVGLGAAAWPLIDQMNPDVRTRAAGDIIEINLADLRPAQLRVVRWHRLPIFVTKRTAAMLASMQAPDFVHELIDPQSDKRQQPDYAQNWHRSIAPDIAVLVGLCTHCRCVLRYLSDQAADDPVGGYFCDCCASHYDPAGRASARRGVARFNLAVPPYEIEGNTVRIGKNPPGSIFFFESIETG